MFRVFPDGKLFYRVRAGWLHRGNHRVPRFAKGAILLMRKNISRGTRKMFVELSATETVSPRPENKRHRDFYIDD